MTDLRTDLISARKATSCKTIAELLEYLVDVLGNELFRQKQMLGNLIGDLSQLEQREKRFYIRAIKEDELSLKVLEVSNYDKSEQKIKLKQIISIFCENNAYSISHGTEIVNSLSKAIGLGIINSSEISTKNSLKSRNIIVVDTSVLLKRPAIINELLEKFDEVLLPKVVISELNYQKDKGNPQIKQKAWLVLSNIGTNKNSRISFPEVKSNVGINDEKIASVACDYAKHNPSDKVFMLSKDVYFPILTKGFNNLIMLSYDDYIKEFPEKGNFDIIKTQNFIRHIKQGNLDKIKSSNNDSEIDINFIDPETGFTPLIIAVRSKKIDLLSFIINNFKDVLDLNKHDKSKYNFTPILHAVQMQRLDIIKMLFEAGADIDVGSNGKNAGNTPLMVCAWHGFFEGVSFFVERGACLNQQDSNGFTALTKACIKGHPKVVELLVGKTDLLIRSRDNKKANDYIESGKQASRELFRLFDNVQPK